jgi:predicted MFS family arabinose efflux permease
MITRAVICSRSSLPCGNAVLGNRWVVLAVLFAVRTMMAIQFQTIGSLGPDLINDLEVEYALLGTLIGLYMLAGVVIALPGGMLIQRFDSQYIALIGLTLMAGGGAIIGIASSFPAIACGRLISGAGAALLNVSLTKMVADWFARREIVTAMSTLITSWPLGIALASLIAVPLSENYGWRVVADVTAVGCFIGTIVIGFMYRHPPERSPSEISKFDINLTRHEWQLVSLAGLIWATFNVSYVVLVSFAPGLFVMRGYSPLEATWLVSLVGWALIASIPLSGLLAERYGQPNTLMIAGFTVVAAATIMLPFTDAPVAVLIIIALAIGLPAGPIMALPAQSLREESRAAGIGVFYTWYYSGMAVLPAIAGFARDLTCTPAAPILFTAAMMGVALACLVGFLSVKAEKHATRRS